MKLPESELHKTFILVSQIGVGATAAKLHLTNNAVRVRMKNLATIQGSPLFFPYDYKTHTREGERLYRELNTTL